MSPTLTVAEIWRFPVKSMGGERLKSAEITELGITGDRGWGIFDVDTGTVLTARRAPELLFATASIEGREVIIDLPDGGIVRGDDGIDGDARLSTWLGRTVELRPAGDEGGTYEVPLDFENDENWVSWQGPGGAWHDSAKSRLSLVSRATLGSWEPARFRTNLVLAGHGEDRLVGNEVLVGDTVRLDVRKRIDRCVIVTRSQPGLGRDLDVLRTINAQRDGCLAIGALVTTTGSVGQGDRVHVT